MELEEIFTAQFFSSPLAFTLPTIALFLFYYLLSRYVRRKSLGERAARTIFFIDLLVVPGTLSLLIFLCSRAEDFTAAASLRLFLVSLLVIAGAWLLNRFLLFYFWADFFVRKYGTRAPKILPNIVAVILYLFAVYIVMTAVLGRSMSGLLVSTGVLVGIIGFALQNFISDFFYGFSITLENPFSKGDWIELSDGRIGQVVDISWRAIHLLSFNNSTYIVPNSVISRNSIHNLSRPEQKYSVWIKVDVDSAYPPELVRRLLTEAALSCETVLTDPMPSVNLADGSGNPFTYYIYVYFADFISHYRGKNDLYMAVHQRLERTGIAPSSTKYSVATEEMSARHYTRPTVKEALQQTELFHPLSEEDIDLLSASAREEFYHPGDMIIREGVQENSLFIITSGVVEVLRKDRGGRERRVERLGAGEFIGEMALLTGQPRSASARALVSAAVIVVPKEGIEPILSRNPALSDQIAAVMVQRQMKDPQFSRRVQESPTPTSRILKLYMNRIGNRISDFFKVKHKD